MPRFTSRPFAIVVALLAALSPIPDSAGQPAPQLGITAVGPASETLIQRWVYLEAYVEGELPGRDGGFHRVIITIEAPGYGPASEGNMPVTVSLVDLACPTEAQLPEVIAGSAGCGGIGGGTAVSEEATVVSEVVGRRLRVRSAPATPSGLTVPVDLDIRVARPGRHADRLVYSDSFKTWVGRQGLGGYGSVTGSAWGIDLGTVDWSQSTAAAWWETRSARSWRPGLGVQPHQRWESENVGTVEASLGLTKVGRLTGRPGNFHELNLQLQPRSNAGGNFAEPVRSYRCPRPRMVKAGDPVTAGCEELGYAAGLNMESRVYGVFAKRLVVRDDRGGLARVRGVGPKSVEVRDYYGDGVVMLYVERGCRASGTLHMDGEPRYGTDNFRGAVKLRAPGWTVQRCALTSYARYRVPD